VKERKGFIFKNKWRNDFESLDPESVRSIIIAAIVYSKDGKDYEFEHADETSVFEMIKKSIDSEKGRHKDGTEF